MTGRHSARGSRGPALLAIAGACAVTAAVIGGGLAIHAGRGHRAAPRAAAQTGLASPASRTAAGSAPPAAASRPPGHAQHPDPLAAAAASYVSARAGTVMAAVYDLKTGQTWTLGRGQPQAEASIVKLDILETLLAQHRDAGLSASDQALAGQMIEYSDNDAATSLWDAVGGAAGIRAYNAAAGLAHTTPSSCVNCPGFPWPGWGLTTTLPADQIALLRKLVEPTPLLTSTERGYALSLMENVAPAQRWGVSGGVPAQATVALKNGWLPLNTAGTDWQINSVGWISGSGRDYLMAVLTTGNPSEQYGIDTISQLATMVWSDLG